MIIAFLIGLLAVLIIANHSAAKEADVSPGCDAAAWLLAIVSFMVLLGVASVVGAVLSDPRIVTQFGAGP